MNKYPRKKFRFGQTTYEMDILGYVYKDGVKLRVTKKGAYLITRLFDGRQSKDAQFARLKAAVWSGLPYKDKAWVAYDDEVNQSVNHMHLIVNGFYKGKLPVNDKEYLLPKSY